MSNVIQLDTIHCQSAAKESANACENEATDSPIANLLVEFEPIIEAIKNNQQYDAAADIHQFKSLLAYSRQEIDQLEDMANYLLSINQH